MSTVIMKRGSNADLENTPYMDGLIFFNTDDKCIYLDNGIERGIYGGRISLLSSVSNNDAASNYNTYSALAIKNGFCIKSNVADSQSNINNTDDVGRPVGCVGFKSIIGTTSLADVGSDGTVTNSVSKINNRLTVNNQKFVFDYKDGKWGFNTSDERGADTFHPFNSTVIRMNPSVTSYTNTDITASTIYLKILKTTPSNITALPERYFYGNKSVPLVTTIAHKTSTNRYIKGRITHYFSDYKVINDGTTPPTGSHKHYMLLDGWRVGAELTPFTRNVKYAESIKVFPFGIPTIKKNVEDKYYRDDEVYYGICYCQHDMLADKYYASVDIYNYIPNDSTGYDKGTWVKIHESNIVETEDYYLKDFAFGKHSVVYHGDIYFINAQYKYSINNADWSTTNTNKLYRWSSRTQDFMPSQDLPQVLYSNNTTIYSMLVHNDKIYVFYKNNDLFYYMTYQNDNWSSEVNIQDLSDMNITNIDTESRWIEYNGSIHILGGANTTRNFNNTQQHISLNDSKLNDLSATLDELRYKYANIAVFKSGDLYIAPDLIQQNSAAVATSLYYDNIEDAKYYVPQYLHYSGTNNTTLNSRLIDTYDVSIRNTYGNNFVVQN